MKFGLARGALLQTHHGALGTVTSGGGEAGAGSRVPGCCGTSVARLWALRHRTRCCSPSRLPALSEDGRGGFPTSPWHGCRRQTAAVGRDAVCCREGARGGFCWGPARRHRRGPAETCQDEGDARCLAEAGRGSGTARFRCWRAKSGTGVNSPQICSRALSSLRLHLSHRSAFEGDLLYVKARERTYQNEHVLVKGKFNFLYKAIVEHVIRAGAMGAVQRGLLLQIASVGTRPRSPQLRALLTFTSISRPHTQPLPPAPSRTTCYKATIL